MAGASQKKQASSNTQTLKEIHSVSLIINTLTILILTIFQRPASKKPFIIFLIPLIICEYVIEKSGRPKFQGNKLVSSGDDLSQSGLTEYLFDLIYYTLFCDLLMILFGSNKVWYLYLIIPAFAIYKLFGLLKMGKQLLGGGGNGADKAKGKKGAAPEEESKSKRQVKMEARNKKQQVRYR